MENRKALIEDKLILPACNLLKNKRIQDHNFEKPKCPTCIFYLGENSEKYYSEMHNDLVRGWGDSALYIRHIKIDTPDNIADSMYDLQGNKISISMLKQQITDMMSNSNVFDDMNFVNVYCLLETSKMNAEVFEKWYSFILEAQKHLLVTLRSTLMVILNQSLDQINLSNEIRERLLSLYNSNQYSSEKTHIYDAVYLFSNRLKNGQYIKLDTDSKEYIDYNLFADLILLTNTQNSETSRRIEKLYNKKIPAFTAAYSNLSKPIRDIVMITLKKCLNIVRTSIDNSDSNGDISDDLISQILNFNNGTTPFIENFYRTHIEPTLSSFDALQYLPCETSCLNMSYKAANERTLDCLDIFVKENYFLSSQKIIDVNKSELMKQIKKQIADRMTVSQQKAFQFYTGDIETIVKSLLLTETTIDEARGNVTDTIRLKIKRNVVNQLIPIIVDALNDVKINAQNSKRLFSDLYQNVNLMISGTEDGLRYNLQSYYENIVELYYMDHNKVAEITKAILSGCNTYEEMLEALKKELESIFKSESVYSMSFIDELVSRVGALGDTINIGDLITRELIDKLDNKLALYSYNTYNERYFEAYFLNTLQNNKNSLFSSLQAREKNIGISVTYQNTLSNDMVESIWFYKCTEDNVRV